MDYLMNTVPAISPDLVDTATNLVDISATVAAAATEQPELVGHSFWLHQDSGCLQRALALGVEGLGEEVASLPRAVVAEPQEAVAAEVHCCLAEVAGHLLLTGSVEPTGCNTAGNTAAVAGRMWTAFLHQTVLVASSAL